MDLEPMQIIFGVGLILVIIAIINKLVIRPSKLIFRLGYSVVFGMILIWAFNYIGGIIGLHLPANVVTILTAGILGVPGLALMVVLQIIV
jgi:inhibitor of the pro-sigma K processing machinery